MTGNSHSRWLGLLGGGVSKDSLASSCLVRAKASFPRPWLCYWLGMTQSVPQSLELQLQYFLPLWPQLSPLTLFSCWILCRTGSFVLILWVHSLLKELYVPGIESQKSALSFSLSSLISKFSSKVAKKKKKKGGKENAALQPGGLHASDCPDALLVVEPLYAAGVPAPCACVACQSSF